MRGTYQSPIPILFIGVLLVVVALAAFTWVWAMRRPISAGSDGPSSFPPPSTPTELPPLVYVGIGASDVVGVGADNPQGESWVNLLHVKMPPDTRFVRLGRNGITLREANMVEVPAVVAANPDLVTMWNCVNDALRGIQLVDYQRELESALDRLTKETSAQVLVLNMPDITLILPSSVSESQREFVRGGIRQWNKGMEATAALYGERVRIVDIFPMSDEILEHPEYISADNFHPSSEGYRRLAAVVWEVISRERLLER